MSDLYKRVTNKHQLYVLIAEWFSNRIKNWHAVQTSDTTQANYHRTLRKASPFSALSPLVTKQVTNPNLCP